MTVSPQRYEKGLKSAVSLLDSKIIVSFQQGFCQVSLGAFQSSVPTWLGEKIEKLQKRNEQFEREAK